MHEAVDHLDAGPSGLPGAAKAVAFLQRLCGRVPPALMRSVFETAYDSLAGNDVPGGPRTVAELLLVASVGDYRPPAAVTEALARALVASLHRPINHESSAAGGASPEPPGSLRGPPHSDEGRFVSAGALLAAAALCPGAATTEAAGVALEWLATCGDAAGVKRGAKLLRASGACALPGTAALPRADASLTRTTATVAIAPWRPRRHPAPGTDNDIGVLTRRASWR